MVWNWDVVMKAIPVVLEGARLTLLLSALGVLFGTVIGALVGLLRSTRPKSLPLRLLHLLAGFYIEVMRGTPLLVQLFLVVYGPPLFLGIDIPEIPAAVIALSVNSGAYVAEIFRGGIESVDRGQMEAGRSLGLNYWQTMWEIIMPQAVKRSLPPLANEFVTLIKESSIVSAIGVQELTFKGRTVGTSTYSPVEPLVVVALVYLIMTFITSRLVKLLERRLKTGDQH